MQEDPNKITYFAKTNSRGKELPFGIKRKDRARHMYVIGKTGMGKSTLLENMAIQDIRNGEGMAFIDPHGSTADRLLEYVPEHRIKDVIYFAPFDMEYPIAFNVMEDVGYDKRHLVVSGLMSAFKKLWVDAWSARMEYILSNTLLALLEYEGSTLLDVNTMYTNKGFRKKVVDNIKDPIVKKFWTEEYANFTDRFAAEATPAIQNKVGQFTSNPLIRNIIGQPKSSFDIREAMDDKKILIINLSKGRVGEVNAALLGSMLVTKIYLAAMSRADVSAGTLASLPNFYFYVDEFQNFANESFADILSEARKYKLNLLIAHQYVEQMEEEVRDAVFGNVGTTVAFRVGPFDAEVLETIFTPQFTATDLVNLGFAQIYLTLMIDGVGSPPFSATTMAPFDAPPHSYVPQVITSSRKQFGKPRGEVDETIAKWSDIETPSAPEAPKPRPAYANSKSPASVPRPAASPRPVERAEVVPVPIRESRVPREARPPLHEASAQNVGEQVAREHGFAASRSGGQGEEQRAERQPAQVAPKPPQASDKPPLEGTNSLREALAQVANRVPDAPPRVSPPREPRAEQPRSQASQMPNLKETLGRIVGEPSSSSDVETRAEQKPIKKEHAPVGLPEEHLRSMLAVDGFDENGQ